MFALTKDKTSYIFKGVLVISHWFICYFQGNRGVLVIYIDFLIFNSRKLRAHLFYAPARGWHSRPLDGAFDATWCSNLAFCHVFRSATVSFFSWYDLWWQLIGGLLLLVIFFSFLEKKHFLNFSPYIFYCLFSSLFLLESTCLFFLFLILVLIFFIAYFRPFPF